jgi:uncharacterized MAPEG superfamily protein
MHFAVWMVLIAALLPYLSVGGAKATPGYDNAAPRHYLDRLQGWRARADWAHRNHFEAFPAFAAAVIFAEMAHAPQGRIDALAGAFVVIRLLYTAIYLADLASLRSVVWFAGVVCVAWLFLLAAIA